MNFILFDDARRKDLLPLTFTRPVADIRIGIQTIREKWEAFLGVKTSTLTEAYLSAKYPLVKEDHNILINGCCIPDAALVAAILNLKPGQVLVEGDNLIAEHLTEEDIMEGKGNSSVEEIVVDFPVNRLCFPWEVFANNEQHLLADFARLTKGRTSQAISNTNQILGAENIFVEAGAKIEFATINATTGPVYIGKDAEVMEGAMIRGPFAMLEHSVVKMGAKIYGPVTLGPYSKIGGEVSHSVFFGYSSKAHDGFIGHSVIGEWCNFGAGSNNSNLKNTYDEVKMWFYPDESFVNTDQRFCGLIFGDHSKCGINTMFNTGTVVGVFANIYGAGFPRQFIPSFTWGGPAGVKTYKLDKAIEVAREVYKRRNLELSEVDENILREVYNDTFVYRKEK